MPGVYNVGWSEQDLKKARGPGAVGQRFIDRISTAQSALYGAAARAGARYTRYADDLAFSFDAKSARRAQGFYALAAGIALAEGFSVNFHKTRFERAGASQRLAGLVVNKHLNVPRRENDRLKAMLHRAAREGPGALEGLKPGDARAQLRGRVEWVAQANPEKVIKLRKLYEQIAWAAGD